MKEKDRQKKSLIYLAGFMGSGKSTIGPILANSLGFEFVDIDKLVEQKAGKRIVDIFAAEGEQTFRAFEQMSLKEVAARSHCVVSLGGGSIANEENFHLIRESGIIVYLQLSAGKSCIESTTAPIVHCSPVPMAQNFRPMLFNSVSWICCSVANSSMAEPT